MDNAQFVKFSTDVDLNKVPAGSSFSATWRMRNTGSTTWNSSYKMTHIHANQGSTLMAGKASYPLDEVMSLAQVRPGDEVDITLQMTAPAPRDKFYYTDWQLQNSHGRFFGDIMWLRVVTVEPPTPPPTGWTSNSRYLADVTIPDGERLEEGTQFTKQWLVKNTGQRKWNDGYRLVYVSGSQALTPYVSFKVPPAAAGEEVVLSIPMTAPVPREEPYISTWRLFDDRNLPFGDSFWIKMYAIPKSQGWGVTPYSQNDPRWRDNILGQGPRTFAEFGCLVADFAMMLSRWGENFDPLALNNRFLQLPSGQGFNGSDVYFAAPAYAIEHVKYYGNWTPRRDSGARYAQYDPNLIARLDTELTHGQGVIVQVDSQPTDPYNPDTEQHWVLVLGRQGADYRILDPLDGKLASLLAKYGRVDRPQDVTEALKDTIISALIYRSTQAVPPDDDAEEVDDGGSSDIGGSEDLAYTGPEWEHGRMLWGVHDRSTRHPERPDFQIANGRFQTVKVMSGITRQELADYNMDFVLCRLFESFNGRDVPVSDLVRALVPDMEPLVQAGVRYFEFLNEPNLTHEGLKWQNVNGSWENGRQFADYFIEGKRQLQTRFPGIKIGFPGLSPGPSTQYEFGHDKGYRMASDQFLAQARHGIEAADFLCVHAYYVTMDEVSSHAIKLVKAYRRDWPDKLLFISEFSNPDPLTQNSATQKGEQARAFLQQCQQIPGVGGAYYFVVSGPGWERQALRREDGTSTGIVEAMFAE